MLFLYMFLSGSGEYGEIGWSVSRVAPCCKLVIQPANHPSCKKIFQNVSGVQLFQQYSFQSCSLM